MAEENKVLAFTEKIRRLTCGMCRVGSGPYGFGVCNGSPSRIGLVVCLTPDPFGNQSLPPDAKDLTASVEAFNKQSRKKISTAEAAGLSESSDPATRMVASTLLELTREPLTVSAQECVDAFDVLADRRMNGKYEELTEQEARQISDLQWYEERTPQEIVDFQLYEKRLCMPFDRFQQAVAQALGRPVFTHEFAIKGLLTREYAEVKHAQGAETPAPTAEPRHAPGLNESEPQGGLKLE